MTEAAMWVPSLEDLDASAAFKQWLHRIGPALDAIAEGGEAWFLPGRSRDRGDGSEFDWLIIVAYQSPA